MTATDDENNKAVVRDFFALMSEGSVEAALAYFADDGEWWVAGSDGPGSTKSLAAIADQWRWVLTGPAKGVKFHLRSLVATGPTVVAEVEADGLLTTGNQYRNRYCFILTLADGHIRSAREYMDTAHATAAFSTKEAATS